MTLTTQAPIEHVKFSTYRTVDEYLVILTVDYGHQTIFTRIFTKETPTLPAKLVFSGTVDRWDAAEYIFQEYVPNAKYQDARRIWYTDNVSVDYPGAIPTDHTLYGLD